MLEWITFPSTNALGVWVEEGEVELGLIHTTRGLPFTQRGWEWRECSEKALNLMDLVPTGPLWRTVPSGARMAATV